MTLDQIMNLNEEIMARDAYNNQAAAQQAYQWIENINWDELCGMWYNFKYFNNFHNL